VGADQPELEVAPFRVAHVGREDDPFPVGGEVRSEVGGAVGGDGVVGGAVGVHDANLQAPRGVGGAGEVLAISGQVFRRLRMVGAVDDLFAVVGVEGAAVVARRVGQPDDARAVGVHRVDLQVPVARGCEDDLLPVAGDGGLRVVDGRG